MSDTHRPYQRRIAATFLVLAFLVAACSTDESTGSTTPDETGSTQAPDTTTTTGQSGSALLPLGTVWVFDEPVDVASFWVGAVTKIGDTVWVVGSRDNGPLAARSVDGGPLEIVDVGGPPAGGNIRLTGVAGSPGGPILLFGSRGFDGCDAGFAVEDGYTRAVACRVTRGATFVSTDAGETFTYTEPAAMALGDRQAVRLDGGTYDGDQFVVVGTMRADDWHGRVWTSANGVDWSLSQELRGTDGTMSAVDIHHDGETYLVVADEHPCAVKPYYNSTPGYILGSGWPQHSRLYAGPDLDSLVPVTNADLPLAPAPIEVDCDADEDGFDTSRIPYPSVRTELVGGVITVIDVSREAAGRTPGTHALAQWIDGTWITSNFDITTAVGPDGEVDPDARFNLIAPVDIEGELALFGVSGPGTTMRLAQPDGEGWKVIPAHRPIVFDNGSLGWAVSIGDELWAMGYEIQAQDHTRSLLRWRSWEVAEDEVVGCVPAPAAPCGYEDMRDVDGYPDFTGADWTGIDLRNATLAHGVYDGVSFANARLNGATNYTGSSMIGTDFTNADLAGAHLIGLDGVTLTGANLASTFLTFVGLPVSWEGVVLADSILIFDPAMGPLDLSGLDLTDSRVWGAGEGIVVIGDLTNATVDGLSLRQVDLSQAKLDGVDISLIRFHESSICPDGSTPVGESPTNRTCG